LSRNCLVLSDIEGKIGGSREMKEGEEKEV
jgi:hypothetical protein